MENIYLCDIDGTLASFKHHRGAYDEHKVLDDMSGGINRQNLN